MIGRSLFRNVTAAVLGTGAGLQTERRTTSTVQCEAPHPHDQNDYDLFSERSASPTLFDVHNETLSYHSEDELQSSSSFRSKDQREIAVDFSTSKSIIIVR
jgi:hypothetical protein